MTRPGRIPLTVLFVYLVSSKAFAQTPAQSVPAKADYAKEAAVAELLSWKVRFENDGTSVQELTQRMRIQSDAGVQRFGLLTFTYQGATQAVEFDYVKVRKPDGSVVLTPPDNVQDLDAGITREAPFYSDLREKHVAVKGLSVGDTVEYAVRWRATKSLAPGQFWYDYNFEHNGIVLDEQLQVSFPQGRAVKVKSPSISPTIRDESGRRIYAWKSSNLEDHSKVDEGKKAIDANLGHLPQPEVQISSFQSWDEVGKWYWGLQAERIQPTADIRAKAAELTKDAKDPSASLRNIYDFVSTKFRYIGVAFGIGRFQPHSADDVLGNQYGDCKDKHTLLASLLQAAGGTAYPALISSSHTLDPDVPSPSQFDHVISAVPLGNTFQWLDTTTEVGPFGYLALPLRGKQALVMPGDRPAMLVTTPADLPFPSFIKFSADGKLGEDGTLDSKMEYSSHGDDEVLLRAVFRRIPQPQWKDLVQKISYGLGFGGTVSDVSAGSPEDTRTPIHFSYSYNRKDYSDWAEHRITMPQLPLALPEVKEDDAHAKDPIWLGPMLQFQADAKVELPKGYTPEMPSDVVLIRDFAEYRSLYKLGHGVLASHRELEIKQSFVPDSAREDYKKFVKNLDDDAGHFIVLTSTSTGVFPAAAKNQADASLLAAIRGLPASENTEARNLERDSYDDMGRTDMAAAIDKLKGAVAADPKFTRAWITLGGIYFTTMRIDEGVDAFHHAIESDPKQLVSYRTLALTLTSIHRDDAAIETWRDLLRVAPDDHDGHDNLGRLLIAKKRYADAVPVLESEVRLNPSDLGPMSRLSSAYLRSGQPDEGYKMLLSVMKLDSSPAVLNNAAYELADANAKLPEALDLAERAVREEEESSGKIHLENLTVGDLHSAERLASYWDTLGWAQFRLGQAVAAEKYLRASWTLSQQPTAADHLGQLYEQRQRRQDAIHMYRLAIRASSAVGGTADPAELQAHLARLVPVSNLSTGFDLHRGDSTGDELSQMRSVKLARIVTEQSSADFFLLLGPGAKVEETRFVTGSEKLKAADKFIRAGTFPASFPEGSKAHLIRRGILSCSSFTGCTMVLYTPDAVTTLN
jgi:tetratricopeptide (TPR) repeat protein/transglutaminase-like putative cysteine protease